MPGNRRGEDGFQILSRLFREKSLWVSVWIKHPEKKNETLANFPSYLISLKGRKTRFNPSVQYSTRMKYHGKPSQLPHFQHMCSTEGSKIAMVEIVSSLCQHLQEKKINLSHEIWVMNIILGSILKIKIMLNLQTFLKFIYIASQAFTTSTDPKYCTDSVKK